MAYGDLVRDHSDQYHCNSFEIIPISTNATKASTKSGQYPKVENRVGDDQLAGLVGC